MTSYFDNAMTAINSISKSLSAEEYLEEVGLVENLVIKDVLLNTGDKEFPDDLREKILNIIATQAVAPPSGLPPLRNACAYAVDCRTSGLISALHSAFHVLAGRRIETRFGRWTDSPLANLKSREASYPENL